MRAPTRTLKIAIVMLAVATAAAIASSRAPHALQPNPLSDLRAGESIRLQFGGRVRERIAAGPYTYALVVDDAGAPRWTVSLGKGPADGARVRVTALARKRDFASPRLGRRFDELLFAVVRVDSQTSKETP